MAKVKSVHAIGRTGIGVNDASSFSLGSNTPLDFDIGERWETKINWSCGFDKVLKSNNCETVLKRSLSELSEGTCLLYNSHKDVKSSDETNNLQLSRETDGPGKNTENSCQELTTDTRVLMAPITDTYKSVPSDISSNDLTDNDFKCLESSPEINELLLQTDFNHVSNVSDFCDWIGSASSSPSESNTNSRLNYVSYPKCESDTFNSELLSLIENGDTQGKYVENLTEPDAGNSISSVSGNSNNENFSGKSLSELALCHLKLDELSQTSNNSSSDIDFNVLSLPLNTDECHIFDTHCESLSNVLLETSSPENKRNGLSSGLPLKENKAVNYENKNIENDLKAETEFYNSDLIPTKDDYVTIDLTDIVFDINKCDISVTRAKSLKLIENSNIVDALMPESSCNIKLNCESFTETKNDRDVHDSCLKSVTVKCDSENLSGLSLCNNNIHNCNLPRITKSEVEDIQLSGNSFLKFDDKNDSLEALTNNTPNMYDMSVNNICNNNLFDKTSHTKDSSVDADLFLKDMLTDIRSNAVSVIDSRPLNGESNLFDLLLSDGKKMKELVRELPVVDKDNLSNLLDSSEVQQSCSVSLADLANSHVFNKDPDKIRNDIDKNISDLKNNLNQDSLSVDDFQSNLPGGKSKANFDIEEKYLSKPNNEAIKIKDFDEKQQFKDNLTRNETLDDEIEPDIDLNFCVRSPVIKNNYFDESSSSESRDSGFDETDLATIKSIIPSFQVSASGKKQEHEVSEHFLSKKRPSLFSIAISCKLNIEKSRREKLNKVRKELLKHSLPVAFVNFNFEDVPSVEKSRNSTDRNACNREGNIEHVSEECEEFSNHMVFSGQ